MFLSRTAKGTEKQRDLTPPHGERMRRNRCYDLPRMESSKGLAAMTCGSKQSGQATAKRVTLGDKGKRNNLCELGMSHAKI